MGRGRATPFTSVDAADETGKDGQVLGLPLLLKRLTPMGLVLMEVRAGRDGQRGGTVRSLEVAEVADGRSSIISLSFESLPCGPCADQLPKKRMSQ